MCTLPRPSNTFHNAAVAPLLNETFLNLVVIDDGRGDAVVVVVIGGGGVLPTNSP